LLPLEVQKLASFLPAYKATRV